MKAVTWHGKRDVRVEQVPDPTIEQPTDAVIRVTSSGLCGSDLHLYEVLGPFMRPGDVLGHEPMGVVEALGSQVPNLSVGDRVVVPFGIACGSCFMCRRDLYAQCESTQVREQGKGAALFGYTHLYGAVPGAQAEYLRVPMAHVGPQVVPDDGSPDEKYLFMSDVLPTAWQGVMHADVQPGDTVAVLGLGPIGQMACRIALYRGAERVLGVDRVPERLALAQRYGVEVLDLDEVDDPAEELVGRTQGRGPDSVIDAVGMEAHGTPVVEGIQKAVGVLPDAVAGPLMDRIGLDRTAALHTAVKACRRGGAVSVLGVYGGQATPMPMMEMFDRGIQMRMGQAHVRRWYPDLLPLVADDSDPLGVLDLTSHRMSLDSAPQAYDMFQHKRDGCIKVVFAP
jgi:threonine dehydrogenase-like Zn-dependent dehydrogenase